MDTLGTVAGPGREVVGDATMGGFPLAAKAARISSCTTVRTESRITAGSLPGGSAPEPGPALVDAVAVSPEEPS